MCGVRMTYHQPSTTPYSNLKNCVSESLLWHGCSFTVKLTTTDLNIERHQTKLLPHGCPNQYKPTRFTMSQDLKCALILLNVIRPICHATQTVSSNKTTTHALWNIPWILKLVDQYVKWWSVIVQSTECPAVDACKENIVNNKFILCQG